MGVVGRYVLANWKKVPGITYIIYDFKLKVNYSQDLQNQPMDHSLWPVKN